MFKKANVLIFNGLQRFSCASLAVGCVPRVMAPAM
jgi:hypothetical protein